ncbi:MAG: hypothetical protein JWR81_474 [Pseudonocardia sp.]|jgi:hypothetical protein|nr:hypothetical protein [Pseudonocardia sp.]MDT7614493.1 hypothetical protein [Pseudonocardiales bacterium]
MTAPAPAAAAEVQGRRGVGRRQTEQEPEQRPGREPRRRPGLEPQPGPYSEPEPEQLRGRYEGRDRGRSWTDKRGGSPNRSRRRNRGGCRSRVRSRSESRSIAGCAGGRRRLGCCGHSDNKGDEEKQWCHNHRGDGSAPVIGGALTQASERHESRDDQKEGKCESESRGSGDDRECSPEDDEHEGDGAQTVAGRPGRLGRRLRRIRRLYWQTHTDPLSRRVRTQPLTSLEA